MNKAELVAAMAEKSGMKKAAAEMALEAFISTVEESVAAKEPVRLIGFGTFEARERAKRKGKNPQTGKSITIPARTVPVFKAGKAFKMLLASAKKRKKK